MGGGRVGYQAWQEFVLFAQSWCDTSVLGSQVFGQASMESCDIEHADLQTCFVNAFLEKEGNTGYYDNFTISAKKI